MSQSGAPQKDSEISTPSTRSEIINTPKNKLDLLNPDIFLMKTQLSKEDEPDISTNTGNYSNSFYLGVFKKTLLSLPIEIMIITKERKSEHQKYPIGGKESVLPTEMSGGQKHFSEKMSISFEKGKSENKSDNTSEATSSEEDSWKDPLGEVTEGSSIEILTDTQSSSSKPKPFIGQKFSFAKFILHAKELPLPQRVYKNPKAKHSNIEYNEKIQSNLVPTVQ
ncbi:hypothetical protein BY996DRAFT_6415755 [Phakopsora pachyrhizi]|nr:hypothetical protein BY996DRAFT_6415755 [Phakopsora pachyrhizi]